MDQKLEVRPYTTWQLIKVYWQSNQRFFAYSMLATLVVMSIFLVGMDVILTTWYNFFYDALQEYAYTSVLDLLAVFLFLAGVMIVVSVYRYVQQYLGLRWRRWLTDRFLDRWLAKRSYYYLETFDEHTDNPQRIQEDVKQSGATTLSLVIGLVQFDHDYFCIYLRALEIVRLFKYTFEANMVLYISPVIWCGSLLSILS